MPPREVVITKHAVDRYLERVAPDVPPGAARAVLRRNFLAATPLREKTNSGESIRVSEALGAAYIVKNEKDQTTVVTMLSLAELAERQSRREREVEDARRDIEAVRGNGGYLGNVLAMESAVAKWRAKHGILVTEVDRLRRELKRAEKEIRALRARLEQQPAS